MLIKPGFKAFETGVRHAHVAHLAHEAYNYLKRKSTSKSTFPHKKQIMAPINRTVSKNVRNETASTTRGATVKYGKKKKGVVPKKVKKVKVPKKLRTQVKEVLRGPLIKGSYRMTGFGGFATPGTVNTQDVCVGLRANGFGINIQNPFQYFWAFNPEDWIHMISVLWNDKTDSSSSGRNWQTPQTLGNTTGSNRNSVLNAPAQTGASGLVFTVKNSWERYKLKNNSQRTWTIDVYECAPKVVSQEGVLENDANGASTIVTNPAFAYPDVAWSNSLKNDQRDSVRVDFAGVNLLYTVPTSTVGFNSLYKTQKTTIILEPGQTYSYLMRGPKELKVAVNKLFMATGSSSSNMFNIQKYSRIPMFVYHCDLEVQVNTGGASATVGRYGGVTTATPQHIAIERTAYASFYMPEEVGAKFNVNVAPVVQYANLNFRRPAVFETVYTQTGLGAITRIDEEQPATVENP